MNRQNFQSQLHRAQSALREVQRQEQELQEQRSDLEQKKLQFQKLRRALEMQLVEAQVEMKLEFCRLRAGDGAENYGAKAQNYELRNIHWCELGLTITRELSELQGWESSLACALSALHDRQEKISEQLRVLQHTLRMIRELMEEDDEQEQRSIMTAQVRHEVSDQQTGSRMFTSVFVPSASLVAGAAAWVFMLTILFPSGLLADDGSSIDLTYYMWRNMFALIIVSAIVLLVLPRILPKLVAKNSRIVGAHVTEPELPRESCQLKEAQLVQRFTVHPAYELLILQMPDGKQALCRSNGRETIFLEFLPDKPEQEGTLGVGENGHIIPLRGRG